MTPLLAASQNSTGHAALYNQLGYFTSTSKFAVSATADYFTNDGPNSLYTVVSDRAVHIRNAGPGSDANPATIADFLIPADTLVSLQIQPGDRISFVLETGETDGSIYFAAG